MPSAPAALSLYVSPYLTNRTTTRIHSCNGWSLLFRRKCVHVCKRLGMWGFSKYNVFSFPLLALRSSHWKRFLLSPPLSSVHPACVTEPVLLQQPYSHSLYPKREGLSLLKQHLLVHPCKKTMKFPLFENDISTYSNSWLIKEVSVDGCQEYMD